MFLFYLAGLGSIIFTVGRFLIDSNLNLSRSRDLVRVLSSFFAIYFYLGSFLAVYVHKAAIFSSELLASQAISDNLKCDNYNCEIIGDRSLGIFVSELVK